MNGPHSGFDSTRAIGGLALSEGHVVDELVQIVDLDGADVLEIGGAVDADRIQDLGVRSWTSLDVTVRVNSAASSILGRAEQLPVCSSSVDVVFSSNAFQFVEIRSTFAEIRRVLRPGGLLLAHFGPIWGAIDGHQLEYVSFRGQDLVFWQDPLIPPWGHLRYDRSGLLEVLSSSLESELAEILVTHIFDSDTINRRFFEDYIDELLASGLEWVSVDASSDLDYKLSPPKYVMGAPLATSLDELQDYWSRRRGRPCDLSIRDVRLVARRPIAMDLW